MIETKEELLDILTDNLTLTQQIKNQLNGDMIRYERLMQEIINSKTDIIKSIREDLL